MINLMLTTVLFSLEAIGECEFPGYADVERWNGWARPYFSFETAQQIVVALKEYQPAFYDATADQFIFEVGEGEVEVFGAVMVEELGKLYAIGAGSWMWEEVKHGDFATL